MALMIAVLWSRLAQVLTKKSFSQGLAQVWILGEWKVLILYLRPAMNTRFAVRNPFCWHGVIWLHINLKLNRSKSNQLLVFVEGKTRLPGEKDSRNRIENLEYHSIRCKWDAGFSEVISSFTHSFIQSSCIHSIIHSFVSVCFFFAWLLYYYKLPW